MLRIVGEQCNLRELQFRCCHRANLPRCSVLQWLDFSNVMYLWRQMILKTAGQTRIVFCLMSRLPWQPEKRLNMRKLSLITYRIDFGFFPPPPLPPL